MGRVCCYGMYGLIGGPFPYGLYYSAGMDLLAKKLRQINSRIDVRPTFGWSEWGKIARDIESQSLDTRVVLFGHSMGANQLFKITEKLSTRTIDLVAAFDPTIWYPVRIASGNIRHLIWLRGTNPISLVGHGRIRTAPDFSGKLEKHNVRDRHEKIDDNEDLHGVVLRAVKDLI